MAEHQRVALVTGGNRGIGLATARGLAALGFRVYLGARDIGAGRKAAETIEGDVRAIALDVANDVSVRECVAAIERDNKRCDVLVNNAGIFPDRDVPGLRLTPRVVAETFDVNAVGALRGIQAVAPLMRRHRFGRIVNLTSGLGVAASMDDAGLLGYKVSKLALGGITRILAMELHGANVLVNAVDPGWVRTNMGGSSAPRTPEQGADSVVYAATLPDNGPTGKIIRDRTVVEW